MTTRYISKIPVGTVFIATHGVYDDYCVQGVFKAIEDLSKDEISREYLLEYPEQKEEYQFSEYGFLKWLVSKELVEELSICEMNTGYYATMSLSMSNTDPISTHS